MSKVKLKCFCGGSYEAREADIKRGWGKTCSKSCASIKREYGRPNAKYLDGSKVEWGKKYKRKNKPIDKREIEKIEAKERMSKLCGHYPFSNESEMYDSMCDDPLEGR